MDEITVEEYLWDKTRGGEEENKETRKVFNMMGTFS